MRRGIGIIFVVVGITCLVFNAELAKRSYHENKTSRSRENVTRGQRFTWLVVSIGFIIFGIVAAL